MALRKLTLMMLILGLGACSFKKPSDQSPEQKAAGEVIQNIEQQKFNGQLSEENVKVEFVEAEDPGMYILVISWPKDVPGMKISVNEKPYTILNDAHHFRRQAIHGEKIDLHLIALNSIGGEISSLALSKTAPSDLIVQSNMVLKRDADFNVNRVYFFENSRIFTDGNNLTIEAKKLISTESPAQAGSGFDPAQAHILTTRPGETATDRSQIKSSHIHIKVEKALGVIRIGMFGLNGLDGRTGATGVPTPALNGTPGTAGDVMDDFDTCVEPPCRASAPRIICAKNPTAGQAGLKGVTGARGEDGMNGGNPGSLTFFAGDSSEFRLEVTLKAGAPGQGGPGGQGSPGGTGGAPGENPLGKCSNAQRGTDGPQGEPGQPGAPGHPGAVLQPVTNVKNISLIVLK